MKKLRIQTDIDVFPAMEQLPADEQELLAAARAVIDHSYAPYSNFRVAAAVRLANGRIVTGNNMENASYPLCICAEQVALGAASSHHPGIPVTAMAIAVKGVSHPVGHPAAPCGACRQVISENEDRHDQPIVLLLQGETGDIYRIRSVKDILPLSFDGTYL